MAIARSEPVSEILRVWADDDARYGDRFCWAAHVRFINRFEIEICAYMEEIKPSIRRAIFRWCQEKGIKRIFAVNYPDGADGERVERWFNVPEPATKIQRFYNSQW